MLCQSICHLACKEHVWIRLPKQVLKGKELAWIKWKQLIADKGRRDREVVVNFFFIMENYWWGIEDICIWACVAEYIHDVI